MNSYLNLKKIWNIVMTWFLGILIFLATLGSQYFMGYRHYLLPQNSLDSIVFFITIFAFGYILIVFPIIKLTSNKRKSEEKLKVGVSYFFAVLLTYFVYLISTFGLYRLFVLFLKEFNQLVLINLILVYILSFELLIVFNLKINLFKVFLDYFKKL